MAPTPTTGYLFAEHMMWHNPGFVQVSHAAGASNSRVVATLLTAAAHAMEQLLDARALSMLTGHMHLVYCATGCADRAAAHRSL
jgi:hypothetical protein